jgi:hypothetical protein
LRLILHINQNPVASDKQCLNFDSASTWRSDIDEIF